MFKMEAPEFLMLVTIELDEIISQSTAIFDFENAPGFAIHFICYWLAHHRFINLFNMTLTVNVDVITWHLHRKSMTLVTFLLPSFYYSTLGYKHTLE